ncbi:MAG: glycosyltransferase [Candidatus Diapherotrites archaeon]|nr:glycosyltransferase [Candidatus Diapherotrites archaeon]
MRVVVIGPVKPFRGGIAHSNTILCRNLAKKNDLLAISFKRLFPKFLYPGRFQKEDSEPASEFKSEFIIDSINPLSWFRAVKRIKEFKANVVVFQWWTTFLVPCYWFIANRVKKHCRVSVVCQNVLPHEESRIHLFLTKLSFRNVHHFVTLSRADEKLLKSIMPKAKVKTIVEPTYEQIVGLKKIAKNKARKLLGIEHEKVLLFFGFVRPYKGLRYLIEALPEVLKKHNCLLLIVGEFWEPKEQYLELIEKLGIKENVRIVDRYVPNEEVPLYFNASDAVVLPYVSSTESGIIQLAYGYNIPVITTRVGGNPDLIEHKKSGLLVKPCDAKALAKAINYFYDKKMEIKFKQAMKEKVHVFEWTEEKERAVLGVE